MTTRISFVCLGNICRSPTAEGVARHLLAERDQMDVEVESAGTGAYHVGNPPDRRATEAAADRGIALDGRARKFDPDDFGRLDLVLAMDRANLADLQAAAAGVEDPPPIRLLREWDAEAGTDRDVPDPYYGGADGFEEVLDMVTRSVEQLLDEIDEGRIGPI
ncbi:low molecular weight protein-tyrosine-phosphatase [Euzebya tangerina]|uniref:low molecular weight protein-tyrosine-phosphatase n=1 Tax=Euzebya tangerina TaxID=591198 RepID=UPI000E30F787|nr:low molecular weight protein-tyrosine-phosphatase [Euzebya tangerina]